MIDAEQTYFQEAIDNIVTDLQRRYNTGAYPVVYGTYQVRWQACMCDTDNGSARAGHIERRRTLSKPITLSHQLTKQTNPTTVLPQGRPPADAHGHGPGGAAGIPLRGQAGACVRACVVESSIADPI